MSMMYPIVAASHRNCSGAKVRDIDALWAGSNWCLERPAWLGFGRLSRNRPRIEGPKFRAGSFSRAFSLRHSGKC